MGNITSSKLWSQHQSPRDRSRDQSQIEVDCGKYLPPFNQSYAEILVGGMSGSSNRLVPGLHTTRCNVMRKCNFIMSKNGTEI